MTALPLAKLDGRRLSFEHCGTFGKPGGRLEFSIRVDDLGAPLAFAIGRCTISGMSTLFDFHLSLP